MEDERLGEEHGCQGRGPSGGLEAYPTGRAEERGLILWVVRTMGALSSHSRLASFSSTGASSAEVGVLGPEGTGLLGRIT